MQSAIDQLQHLVPTVTFTTGKRFYWSPETNEVVYNELAAGTEAVWSLLHETGHAILGHQSYSNDFELLELEIAAWEEAKKLASNLGLPPIDEEHVQDCLDTYRDWLHKRCLCPKCGNRSFQQDNQHYLCYNCSARWQVTPSRFCRAYRTITTPAHSL